MTYIRCLNRVLFPVELVYVYSTITVGISIPKNKAKVDMKVKGVCTILPFTGKLNMKIFNFLIPLQ